MTLEIHVSTDIEAHGPIRRPNSMLSFASAAYSADKTLVSTFTRNLTTLQGASADAKSAALVRDPATIAQSGRWELEFPKVRPSHWTCPFHGPV